MGDDVERKGLGTPATRADIIEKLVKDGFVKREKKQDVYKRQLQVCSHNSWEQSLTKLLNL